MFLWHQSYQCVCSYYTKHNLPILMTPSITYMFLWHQSYQCICFYDTNHNSDICSYDTKHICHICSYITNHISAYVLMTPINCNLYLFMAPIITYIFISHTHNLDLYLLMTPSCVTDIAKTPSLRHNLPWTSALPSPTRKYCVFIYFLAYVHKISYL